MMKHPDDKGDLSVFAGGNQLLFVCNKGHYWIVESQLQAGDSQDSSKVGTKRFEDHIASRFGEAAVEILRGSDR